MKRSLMAAVAACALASPVAAQNFYTGNDLLRLCESDRAADLGICIGYVSAVFDVSRNRFCTDGLVNGRQIVDVATTALRRYPTTRHKDADVLVELAFMAAWPCRQQNTPQGTQRTF